MATGSEASRGLKPFAAAPRPEPMHGASSHPNPRNVASLRSRNQVRFSCLISDSSLLLTYERRFAPTTVRYRRISVRYESEQVSAFIGIRSNSTNVVSRFSCTLATWSLAAGQACQPVTSAQVRTKGDLRNPAVQKALNGETMAAGRGGVGTERTRAPCGVRRGVVQRLRKVGGSEGRALSPKAPR